MSPAQGSARVRRSGSARAVRAAYQSESRNDVNIGGSLQGIHRAKAALRSVKDGSVHAVVGSLNLSLPVRGSGLRACYILYTKWMYRCCILHASLPTYLSTFLLGCAHACLHPLIICVHLLSIHIRAHKFMCNTHICMYLLQTSLRLCPYLSVFISNYLPI